MMMKRRDLLVLWLFSAVWLNTALGQKKAMDDSVFDGWNTIERPAISANGRMVTYEINPQEGDGSLFIYDADRSMLVKSVERGTKSQSAADGSFVVYSISPQHKVVRKMKLDKVKKDKMPKDSVGIFFDGREKRYPQLKSFVVPSEGGNWTAIHREKDKNGKKDTAAVKKKFKSEGTPLYFMRPSSGDSLMVSDVIAYAVAAQGTGAYVMQSVGDSAEVSVLLRFNPARFVVDTLMKRPGKAINLATSKDGNRCTFLFSTDTVKTKSYSLFCYNAGVGLKEILPVENSLLGKAICASEFYKANFSEDGKRLFFGLAPRPVEEPKDTLTDDEKYHVDVWSWTDDDIQPVQKVNLKKDKERTSLACYDITSGRIVPLADDSISRIVTNQRGNSGFALGYNGKPYMRDADFRSVAGSDIYLVDLASGSKKLLLKRQSYPAFLTSDGRHLLYYAEADSCWHSLVTASLKDTRLGVPGDYPFYDEQNDMPDTPWPAGFAGFSDDNRYAYVYDRYDVWQFDLNNSAKKPRRLTNGRESLTRFRYLKVDDDEKGISLGKTNYFTLFNEKSRKSGLASLSKGKTDVVMEGDYQLLKPVKAKNSSRFMVRRSTFSQYPEIEITDASFKTFSTISNTNPQQSDYLWGDIRLVNWTTPKGKNLEGLLVTPENLDPDKKYPVLIYFYERSSDNLHQHITPRPSRSIINWAFCASNGYVVFIPDITYETGKPGESAYDAIVSGAESMARQFPFIDKSRMALQGQSWGGYQIAWLVTRTDMFKCAMAGAPVSNMTSAYGGIRWQTGRSRIFQYERTQSRIGSMLWDDIDGYIENSPLFFAPNVKTPLLMMHNDNDGAVPWYQGIEYFMALRRLNKPVWMLVYNNEEHNLLRRANTKDLNIRMMQFFDHYLKDAPMPVWMRDGIPAIDKGRKNGYEMTR
jgi:dipeptidyl aminopeptidase/acylaminoacyl peptidase